MAISPDRIALNTVQWINIRQDPSMPPGVGGWELNDPGFRAKFPRILDEVVEAGWDAIPLGVLPHQTLQDYERLVTERGLRQAPGYVQVTLPEDDGLDIARGSADWVRRLDGVRRAAECANYFGLDVAYLSADIRRNGRPRTMEAAAVGHSFDQGRLERETELLADAAETLHSEGIRAAFHNHVGTWIETRFEIDYVMQNIDAKYLGGGFDTGHAEWAGVDAIQLISDYRDRVLGIHLKDTSSSIAAESRANPRPYYESIDAGVQREPGLGDLDLPGILRALSPEFDGWVIVEVDKPTMAPLESARVSAEWVETVYAPIARELQAAGKAKAE
jgi:inosose dehydratase